MDYRTGNYCAFYVDEPFDDSLGVYTAHDFCYYNILRLWKKSDSTFPFNDAHDKTYDVRDGSDFETTLVPRLRLRLRKSKNVILILSSNTKNSAALREEIDYAINTLSLPIIVLYPELEKNQIHTGDGFTKDVKNLWDKLPVFRDNLKKVSTYHLPFKKEYIIAALKDPDLMVQNNDEGIGTYYLK